MGVLASIFEVAIPILLVVIALRWLGASFKYVVLGMCTFLVSEMVLRLPLIALVSHLWGNGAPGSRVLQYSLLSFSLLTTGFFEETARFLGYRWFTGRTAKTWLLGAMCGIGHGGCESFGLGVAGVFSAVSKAAIVQPLWLPLVDVWVRLWAMCLHIALSLMVLRVFQRRQIRWLWIAIGIHVLVNLAGTMISQLVHDATTARLVNALAVSFFGALGLWYVLHLRMVETPSRAEPSVAAT